MSQLFDMIMYRANRLHYTPDELSVFMRINPTTFYKRKREPETFRLSELQQLAKKLELKITIDIDGSVSAKGEL